MEVGFQKVRGGATVKPLTILLTSINATSQIQLISGNNLNVRNFNKELSEYSKGTRFHYLYHEDGGFLIRQQRKIMQPKFCNYPQKDSSNIRNASMSSLCFLHASKYGLLGKLCRRSLEPLCLPSPRGIRLRDNRIAYKEKIWGRGGTHRETIWCRRAIHTMVEEVILENDMKPAVDDARADLESKMNMLRGGVAEGESLESLKVIVDQLMSCPGPDDFLIAEACLLLAQSFAYLDQEPSNCVHYAKRALGVYQLQKNTPDYPRCLYLLGYGCFRLEDYTNAVTQFEQCNSALGHLSEIGCDNDYCHSLKPEVEAFLGRTKMLLLKHSQAVVHYKNFLELKENLLEPDDPELGASYLQAAQAFRGLKDTSRALDAALKALDTYSKISGPASLKAAEVRSFLCGLYCEMGKYKDSLAEADAARPILQEAGDLEEVAYLDFRIAEDLQQMGKHDESIRKLEEIIRSSELTSAIHFNALLSVARACATTKKSECVAEYCVKVYDALRNEEPSSDVALSLALLALVYEEQREFYQAIDILKQVKSMLEGIGISPEKVPAFAAADIDGKLGFLSLRLGKATEALPYLQYSLSKKKTFHARELLYLHFNLGAAYIQLQRFQEAPQELNIARNHLSGNATGLDASKRAIMFHNLSRLYKACRRHRESVECDKAAKELSRMIAIEKGEEL